MKQQTAEGNWNQLKGKIRQQWGDITGDELEQFEGNLDELVGWIQEKTGEGRESVEEHIAQFAQQIADGEEASEPTSDAEVLTRQAQQLAEQASAAVQQKAEQAADAVRGKYREAESAVRERPLESLALTFAAGLVVGVGATLILRSK